jgi:ribosome-associated protein YbcJ (S4-like RNA binding protein)
MLDRARTHTHRGKACVKGDGVDDEVELRRGRQVRPGSTVELGETRIRVTSGPELSDSG